MMKKSIALCGIVFFLLLSLPDESQALSPAVEKPAEWKTGADCKTQHEKKIAETIDRRVRIDDRVLRLPNTSFKERICFDKYRSFSLEKILKLPSFSQLIKQALDQACSVADDMMDELVKPLKQRKVWRSNGLIEVDAVFGTDVQFGKASGGKNPVDVNVDVGSSGEAKLPRIFK